MNDIINYIIESSIILIILFVIYHVLFSKEKCFHFRRYYLLLTPVFAFIMPLLKFETESVTNSTTANSLNIIYLESVATIQNSTSVTINYWSWWDFTTLIYIGISTILILVFFKNVWNIWLLKSKGILQKHKSYNIITTNKPNLIFTFLKDIYVPKDEIVDEKILSHEKVHAIELHSYDILFYEILTILFWFNPIIHLLKLATSLNHEFIADAKVSESDNPNSYINTLTEFHLKNMELSLGSHFSKPSILKRIKMINNQNTKTMKIKYIIPVITVTIMFTLFCCEGQQEINKTPDIPQTIEIDSPEGGQPNTYNSEPLYEIVENQPTPENGLESYYKWIGDNIKYPENDKNNDIGGKVFVQFIIDKKGAFKDVTIVGSVSPAIDKEALRVVKMSEPWNAGIKDGEKVNVRMIIPITFKTSNDNESVTANEFEGPMIADITYNSELVYDRIEQQPNPKESMYAYYKWISENVKYPETAKKEGIEGKVFIQFIIDKKGQFQKVTIKKGVSPALDAEALRVAKMSENWSPGIQDGKEVNTRMIIPISFKLKE